MNYEEAWENIKVALASLLVDIENRTEQLNCTPNHASYSAVFATLATMRDMEQGKI